MTAGAPRCAVWARSEAVDPIGTAGCYAGFLLIEWPQPWPADLGEVPELSPLREVLAGAGIRLQAVVDATPSHDRHRVILHRGSADPGGWFRELSPVARTASRRSLVDTALALVESGDGEPGGRDLLVCAHGRRDVCCGSRGTALAMSPASARLAGSVRVWRTSHTGGHRFAPTAFLLPEATSWAFLDDDALSRIIHRHGELDDLLARYRGCAGLPTPRAQVLDRFGFEQTGWSWLDHARRVSELADGRLRLDAVDRDGASIAWDVVVNQGRGIPIPVCGAPAEQAEKMQTAFSLGRVVRVR